MFRILILALALVLGVPGAAAAGPKEDVAAATLAWKAAYDSRNPQRALALYAPDAVFWGTRSRVVRDTPAAILDYFKAMPQSPHSRVILGQQRIRVYGNIAINTGYYTFSVLRGGERVNIPARFSFTYRLTDGKWMIVDHHSSRMPAPRKKTPKG